jgi:[protein-PII] uridylyltransferase
VAPLDHHIAAALKMTNQVSPPDSAILKGLSPRLLPELRRYLSHHGEQLRGWIGEHGAQAGRLAAARHAKAIDGLISSLYHATMAALPGSAAFSISAVGSYGRNSLSPFSDLDLRLLCERDPEHVQAIAEALLYPLWEVGLNIGHQVVTAEQIVELAQTDFPTATTLLDWRHLAGIDSLSERLMATCFAGVFGPDEVGVFLQELMRSSYARKERFGSSVYLLEPDIKNGSGGLRDVDVAYWAARARWRVRNLDELVGLGVLLPDEWREFSEGIEFLMRLRNALHISKNRKIDRIGFEEQEHLAREFMYGQGGPGAEALMSDYYRHARVVELTSDMIVRRAVPPPKIHPTEVIFGDGTKQVGDTIALDDEDAVFLEPSLALLVFHQGVKRELKVAESTRRAIARAVSSESFQTRLRSDPKSAELFRKLVNQPKETRFKFGSVLTELHETGLLLAMIPEFLPVVGRVHHDIYHVYTVDIHSIAAVDKQRNIFRGVEAKQLSLASRLARVCERREVLFFATLLHDVGKDTGGRQHATRGADLARVILARLGFVPADIEAVAKLIEAHLKMYLFATRRDLDDVRTLEAFAQAVDDEVGLRNLYLLTVADVSTTSPTSLTPWKLKMLDELYHAAHRYLVDGEQRRAASDSLIAKLRGGVPPTVTSEFLDAFLSTVPTRYLTSFEPDDLIAHISHSAATRVGLSVHVTRGEGTQREVCIIGDDAPGFLAKVCAAFNHAKFKVINAQIYSWQDGDGRRRTIDLFWVMLKSSDESIGPALRLFEQTLIDVVSGRLGVLELVGTAIDSSRQSQRPAPAVPIQVRIDNEGSMDRTIIEVITRDRVGLLFWISETLYECGLSIDLAKIHTEGARVTDVFYVTTEARTKLVDEERIAHVRQRLLARLHHLEGKAYPELNKQ